MTQRHGISIISAQLSEAPSMIAEGDVARIHKQIVTIPVAHMPVRSSFIFVYVRDLPPTEDNVSRLKL
jgi:hypothetical protein